MKLEDCTKEEIIHYLRRRCFDVDKDIEFDILVYRSEQTMNAEMSYKNAASDYLQEYIDLLKPYEGQKISNVPLATIKAAAEVMKRREVNIKKADRERKKYEQISKRMDALLK